MNTKLITTTALAALVTTASAVSANAVDYTPFARAELAYTDTGYDASVFQPEGFELGAAFTTGVLLNQNHELSFSTGLTKWEGENVVTVGLIDFNEEVEQIPLLLNYRYRFAVTEKLTLSVGPTVGVIHEKATGIVRLNTVGAGIKPAGSYADTDWKLAAGGTLAADYRLSDQWTLTASAQALHVDSSTYDTVGVGFTRIYGSTTRVGFTLGASYAW